KRLSAYASVVVEEVPDHPVPDFPTPGQRERILTDEADKLLSRMRERDWVVALALDGRRWSSEEFARQWEVWSGRGAGRYIFVIGGTLGLHDQVIRRANVTWSLSPLTFPHQLARVIVLEQLYRAFQILHGGKYHR
ncbi:MAG: 23S rRNA (pseudouridine(1915)-N(3))-methyltransferase RlmH, partial [Alicyclobacillaceae bacterium]|nr:23S rRNA (pseudouridine(1915)-N(3))-methyltransferase RlmH [Alicyclobacillaceae bacterium]